MNDHAYLLEPYKRLRAVNLRLGNRLTEMVTKQIFEASATRLGMFAKKVITLETEDEAAVLMDYCLYSPDRTGKNLIMRYRAGLPPTHDPEELAALEAMSRAYYSLFKVVAREQGVGIEVVDVLRDRPGFIVDVGLGTTAKRNLILATRAIPFDSFLITGGAGIPVEQSAATRVASQLVRLDLSPETIDFNRISPHQEAEVAALIIRECRAAGMTSRVAYAEPGTIPGNLPAADASRQDRRLARVGRNDRCPCGSGRKYKVCCGAAEPR